MNARWVSGILFLAAFLAVAQPVITLQLTNQTIVVGNTAKFYISVSGNGPFTYQWQFNGINLPPSGIIATVAGNGTNSFSGDGGDATGAMLFSPWGVAIDTKGNLLIADSGNGRLRLVNTNGIITTAAGNGTDSFSGDGGSAINAGLSSPSGVAVDGFGNLFIADLGNNRIRKVDTNGMILTVAGNGTFSFSGDGGPSTNAALYCPFSVAESARGNLFIAEYNNNRIRTVDTNGMIATFAGNGTFSFYGDGRLATDAGLMSPRGVVVDGTGNIFIADYLNNRIRKVDTNGIINTYAGNGMNSVYATFSGDGGAATNAMLSYPVGVAVDNKGNLFIADSGNGRIRMVNPYGIITTVAGNGTNSFSGDGGAGIDAGLNTPSGVAVDGCGNLFIADCLNNRVRKVQINSPKLLLNNVSTNNSGNYSVVITDSGGSITSNVAKLAVVILPSIASQPQPITVTNGFPASFSVTAGGLPSLAFQWQFNGTNLLAATNTTLAFQHAFPDNAGPYTVVITNAYGSATSNPALLTILPIGIIAPTMLASGQFQLGFNTLTGVNYVVQYSTNLTQWIPFVTLAGNGVPLIVIDPNTASSKQRFYRITLSPQ